MHFIDFIQLDQKSLLAVLFWTNLVCIVLNLSFWPFAKQGTGVSAIKSFFMAKAFQAATWGLLLFRDSLPDILTMALANSLFLVGIYFESLTISEIAHSQITIIRRRLFGILCVCLIIFNVVDFMHHSAQYRILFMSLGNFAIILQPSLALLFRKGAGSFVRVLGVFYSFFGILLLWRTWTAYSTPGITMYTQLPAQSLTYLSMVLLNTLGCVALFLFMQEKLNEANRQHEAELKEAVAVAREASQSKTNFLANMSHEIRTPMNVIVGFAELAANDPSVTGRTKDYMAKIKSSAEILLQIISDILDISKIEAGRVSLESVPFDLHDVLTLCQTIGFPNARAKGLELYFYSEPFIDKQLLGDPARLRQVMFNLVSNAIKFTNFGMVKVSALVEEVGQDRARLYFEVKDSGIGMSREQIDRVFEPFSQGDNSNTRRYGGAGLGLPISKTLIEMLGGRLEVESTPGLGTKFSFRLEFQTTDIPSAAGVEVQAQSFFTHPGFYGDVLVCEDNLMNQEVVEKHLSTLGIRVTIAKDGQTGVEKVRERMARGAPYDLILMDIHMPVMSGLEAARIIGDMGCLTPIVALTANVMANDESIYRNAGIEACLGKPFQAKELWACLGRYLPERQAADSSPDTLADTSAFSAGQGEIEDASGSAVLFSEAVDSSRQRVINVTAGLEHAMYNTQLYRRLLTNFLQDNQHVITGLRENLLAGDGKLAHRIVHTLKSSAGMIGAEGLYSQAGETEDLLLRANVAEATASLSALERELEAVLLELAHLEEASEAWPGSDGLEEVPLSVLLNELEDLLESGDSDCLAVAGRIARLCGPKESSVQELVTQIGNYDFEPALATLRRIKARYSA